MSASVIKIVEYAVAFIFGSTSEDKGFFVPAIGQNKAEAITKGKVLTGYGTQPKR
jgi:hypothetical protein